MSNEESQKPNGNEQPASIGSRTISVESRRHVISFLPDDEVATASLPAIPENPAVSAAGRPIRADSLPPARRPGSAHSLYSMVVPSSTRCFSSNPLCLATQVTSDEDDDSDSDCKFPVWGCARLGQHNVRVSSYALVISGRDAVNVAYEQTFLKDVQDIEEAIREPYGMIPLNNISRITPRENRTEREIEDVYSHLKASRPNELLLYYSGHGISDWRFNVSSDQGNALDVARVKEILEGLVHCCKRLSIMLDCCSAAEHILLPMLPAGVMRNRVHVQCCSSKRDGKSYMYEGNRSIFTWYVVSALKGSTACPNKDDNCPQCFRFRRSIGRDGYVTTMDLMEYVHGHMEHGELAFYFRDSDLPQLLTNPVAR